MSCLEKFQAKLWCKELETRDSSDSKGKNKKRMMEMIDVTVVYQPCLYLCLSSMSLKKKHLSPSCLRTILPTSVA